jgi:WD repeat-containing protein 23
MRRPPSVLENATQFFASAAATLVPAIAPSISYRDDELDPFSLTDNEVMEEERGAEGDVDDSPEVRRDIRVLSLPLATRQGGTDGGGTKAARERRRWEVLPITERVTFKSPSRT